MPDSARVAREKARLTELCALVEANRADAESFFAERDKLLRGLKDRGVPRSELLELSGLSVEALKWILGGGRKGRAKV